MPLMACSTAPPRPCQKRLCRSFSLTRAGSSARSPIKSGRSSLTEASTRALLVMALPMPARPSYSQSCASSMMMPPDVVVISTTPCAFDSICTKSTMSSGSLPFKVAIASL